VEPVTSDEAKSRVLKALADFDLRTQAAATPKVSTKRKPRKGGVNESPHRSEYQEQADVCDWLKAKGVVYFAVPNGAYLSGDATQRGIRWRQMARIGAKPGVPDLVVLSPAPKLPSLRFVTIEMKSEVGRASSDQLAWHCTIEACGGVVVMGTAARVIPQLERLGFGG
jgi:hypothetical protein